MLGVGQAQVLQVLACEAHNAIGTVELDGQGGLVVDVGDFPAGAVLDPGLPRCSMLRGEGDEVAFT